MFLNSERLRCFPAVFRLYTRSRSESLKVMRKTMTIQQAAEFERNILRCYYMNGIFVASQTHIRDTALAAVSWHCPGTRYPAPHSAGVLGCLGYARRPRLRKCLGQPRGGPSSKTDRWTCSAMVESNLFFEADVSRETELRLDQSSETVYCWRLYLVYI